MRVAVISDTHDLLRPEVITEIQKSDVVIHAGDFSSQKILDQIRNAMAHPEQFYYVRGNNDKAWAEGMLKTLEFDLEGVRFFLVHNKKEIPAVLDGTQIVIFGHSHKYLEEDHGGCLWLNPGSCGKRRFHQEISMAVLTLDSGNWTVQKIQIMHPEGKTQDCPEGKELSSADLLKLIKAILQRMKQGQQITEIAAALGTEKDFVEEICRIYVTHPGVTANGILDKYEVNSSQRK